MAGDSRDEFDARMCRNCLQKDEKIRKLEAELSKTSKDYREALEKKLQGTENLVAALESEEQDLGIEIGRYQKQTNEAKKETQLEVQNLEACNLALHEKEAAYEKLEKSLEEARRKAEEDIDFHRKECEDVNTANETLLKEFSAACRQNQLLENDLSDARRENKQLREELNQATGNNLTGSENAVVSVDNSKIDPHCVDANNTNGDDDSVSSLRPATPSPSSSPLDLSNRGVNKKSLEQELLAIGEARAEKRKDISQKGGYAYKKPKIEHPANLERTEGAPTRDQDRHGNTSFGGDAAPEDFEFTFCAPSPRLKTAQPVSTDPVSAAGNATVGHNAGPERSDTASAGP
ncbi:hypothetical protein AA0119_g12471 [Alternaria tenuissima]|uniref:Uncharacterized protein n=2 Tax=Alternaria alternata complex TaxID=187734 RepID=A0A4Q4MYP6_ALTAL|nr:hypothetical protein AA0117_g12666 [Alternaria alternata]RYN87314.1 hypothetical protein AA0119_g12471 [Alternaria tenuissima]RYO04372.1 hypothetical protein AA0121_g12829 [Alternaria tenuissima]RYO47924.1 hypothetical protein AA0116_g12832 [Alternaria tenuissima]